MQHERTSKICKAVPWMNKKNTSKSIKQNEQKTWSRFKTEISNVQHLKRCSTALKIKRLQIKIQWERLTSPSDG